MFLTLLWTYYFPFLCLGPFHCLRKEPLPPPPNSDEYMNADEFIWYDDFSEAFVRMSMGVYSNSLDWEQVSLSSGSGRGWWKLRACRENLKEYEKVSLYLNVKLFFLTTTAFIFIVCPAIWRVCRGPARLWWLCCSGAHRNCSVTECLRIYGGGVLGVSSSPSFLIMLWLKVIGMHNCCFQDLLP